MLIALIEDHLMMRDILRKTCTQSGHDVVVECDRGEAVLPAIRRRPAELVILDLQLPDRDGLEIIADLKSLPAPPKILVLSSRCDSFTVYLLERADIAGFVDKISHTVGMLDYALESISVGKRFFSPIFSEIRRGRLEDPRSFDKLLSDREQVVLACLGDCCSDDEIAQRLGISPQTAEKHRFNLMHKLGLRTTALAIRYAQDHGFHFARIRHRL